MVGYYALRSPLKFFIGIYAIFNIYCNNNDKILFVWAEQGLSLMASYYDSTAQNLSTVTTTFVPNHNLPPVELKPGK